MPVSTRTPWLIAGLLALALLALVALVVIGAGAVLRAVGA